MSEPIRCSHMYRLGYSLLLLVIMVPGSLARDGSKDSKRVEPSSDGVIPSYLMKAGIRGRFLKNGGEAIGLALDEKPSTTSSIKQHKILEVSKKNNQRKQKKAYPRALKTIEEDNQDLLEAAEVGNITEVQRLLEKGADVNATNSYGGTALMKAATQGYFEIAKILIYSGADVNACEKYEYTALMYSSWHDHLEVATLLLDSGASVDAKDHDDWTALHYAAECNSTGVAQLLIDSGAYVNVTNAYDRTPLINAANRGNPQVVDILLRCGADIEVKDIFGWRALMYAAREGHLEVAKLLIDSGADLDAVSDEGETVSDIAEDRGLSDMIDLIKRARQNNTEDSSTSSSSSGIQWVTISGMLVGSVLIASLAFYLIRSKFCLKGILPATNEALEDVKQSLMENAAGPRQLEGILRMPHTFKLHLDDGAIVEYNGGDEISSTPNCVVLPGKITLYSGEVKDLAIKYSCSKDKNKVYKLKTEIDNLAKVHNVSSRSITGRENIVQMYGGQVIIPEGSEEEYKVYVMMERMRCNLEEYLMSSEFMSACTFRQMLNIFIQVCSGLHFLHHHGFIHYDIKLKNILVSYDGDVKITDFDMSTALPEGKESVTASYRGTPGYMAPELSGAVYWKNSSLRTSYAVDVYSLGAVFWACLHVCKLTDWERVEKLEGSIKRRIKWGKEIMPCGGPEVIAKLIEDCLKFNPKERPRAKILCDRLSNMMEEDWIDDIVCSFQ